MEFSGELKKKETKEIPKVSKKGWNFQGGVIQKIMWNFPHGFWFSFWPWNFNQSVIRQFYVPRVKLHFF